VSWEKERGGRGREKSRRMEGDGGREREREIKKEMEYVFFETNRIET
jgi:hypothetical protein